MKKAIVTISYEEEKLAALRLYLGQKQMEVEDELVKALEGLYARTSLPECGTLCTSLRYGGERTTENKEVQGREKCICSPGGTRT